jgi:hypothetical protein
MEVRALKRYFIIGSATLVLLIAASSYALKGSQLELIVRSEKPSYSLGELPFFEFEVKNTSSKDIIIVNSLRTAEGYLSVWISKDGKIFEKYDHLKWGIGEREIIATLKPKQTTTTNRASVFWNSKPKFSNSVSSDIAERASAGRILTDYAFPEAGTYYIKASYTIFLGGQAEGVRIESSPVEINITEPTGDDLKVWNKIKENGDFAYFIQEGDFLISSYKTDKRSKLRKEAEEIISQYPDSLIVKQMEKSLQQLRTTEEKMRVFSEKLKQQK